MTVFQAAKSSSSSSSGAKKSLSYAAERVIGNGSFGVVYQASVIDTGETVAIKKVLQDRRFKNRELDIMSTLDHPNVVCLKHWSAHRHSGENSTSLQLLPFGCVAECCRREPLHSNDARDRLTFGFVLDLHSLSFAFFAFPASTLAEIRRTCTSTWSWR